MKTAPPPITCRICGRTEKPGAPLAGTEHYECSHVDCLHRIRLTAAPGDRAPKPKD